MVEQTEAHEKVPDHPGVVERHRAMFPHRPHADVPLPTGLMNQAFWTE